MMLPTVQEMTVVTSSRPRVHGSAVAISSLTGVGNWKKETPKSPRNNLRQNAPYCWSIDPSSPYISVRSAIICSIVRRVQVEPARLQRRDRPHDGIVGQEAGDEEHGRDPQEDDQKY